MNPTIDASPIHRVVLADTAGQPSYSTVGTASNYFVNNLTTTATVTGSGATQICGGTLINLNTAPAYLQIFDTTGAVTLGSTAPAMVIPITSNATPANGSGNNFSGAFGKIASGGIKIACTTAPNGNTVVATGISGTLWWK